MYQTQQRHLNETLVVTRLVIAFISNEMDTSLHFMRLNALKEYNLSKSTPFSKRFYLLLLFNTSNVALWDNFFLGFPFVVRTINQQVWRDTQL